MRNLNVNLQSCSLNFKLRISNTFFQNLVLGFLLTKKSRRLKPATTIHNIKLQIPLEIHRSIFLYHL